MLNAPSDPRAVARFATMRRIQAADAPARYTRSRRLAAMGKGYHGPLTRAELARRTA